MENRKEIDMENRKEIDMENRKEIDMEKLMRDLIAEFDEEKGFYETVYDQFYTSVATSFECAVEDDCKVVIFGNKYAMGVKELYAYDRYLAVELWRDYVNRSFEDFHDWVERYIWGDIENFTNEFQRWLSGQNDERASNAIVALMGDDIDLAKIIVDWICDCLVYGDWDYPV